MEGCKGPCGSTAINGLQDGCLDLQEIVFIQETPQRRDDLGAPAEGLAHLRIDRQVCIALARAQLASQGITNPTTAQLQGALVGTTNTDGTMTQGILQMRASGMGWGKIANTMGFKLGAVMSGKMTYAQATATTTGSSTTSTATSATTASAASHGVGKGIVTGSGGSSSYRGNSGITTAAGGGGNGHLATGLRMGGGQGNGAVNAAGSRAGGNSDASHAGGQGKGKS